MSYPTDHMVIIIISITRSSPLNVRKKTDLGNASKFHAHGGSITVDKEEENAIRFMVKL